MAEVTRTIEAPRRRVWEALVDVRSYPTWLVGARRIRSVDEGWPAPGTAFHHVVGLGDAVQIQDATCSVAVDAERRLELDVRARPFVRATVVFTLSDAPEQATNVTLEEHPTGWHRLLTPLLAIPTRLRNEASLARLEERVRDRMGTTA